MLSDQKPAIRNLYVPRVLFALADEQPVAPGVP
jgi:hypothetical protein